MLYEVITRKETIHVADARLDVEAIARRRRRAIRAVHLSYNFV